MSFCCNQNFFSFNCCEVFEKKVINSGCIYHNESLCNTSMLRMDG